MTETDSNRFRKLFWIIPTAVLGLALIVLFAKWLRGTEPVMSFLATYPGSYDLPEGAPIGFPAWLSWQHFFNAFFIVLIVQSGLKFRHTKRPQGFWSPRRVKPGARPKKISIDLWFHNAVDLLWFINGVLFVVLLFATGQWMRIIPTSWEVVPNAVSAGLQYLSLQWPTENGWVNYNSLQQLTYALTVFIAAPLAALTGVRMSYLWPEKNKALSAAIPMELARKVHFPVMLYFVFFVIVHVTLVLTTGVLRNLNHMYAGNNGDSWWGFGIFAVSLAVMIGAWFAARPVIIRPIAGVFGVVSR
jgi:thiosulfate reductase cytochrome b subunit